MFSIDQHTLQGPAVRQLPTANHGGAITPRFLVMHYTACSLEATVAVFSRTTGTNRVSAHLVVDRDGSVTQMVPFNRAAWHAGASTWQGLSQLNNHSIGIEIVNWGYLNKLADGRFVTADGKVPIPPSDVVEARHKLPTCPYRYWHAYTPEQINTCKELAQVLALAYGLSDIVGHDDIAPTRKVDPGPALPLISIAAGALGRGTLAEPAQPTRVVAVDKLNLRSGPGVAHGLVALPLLKGTRLKPLSSVQDGWLQVEPIRTDARPGWVFADYTSAA